MGFEIELYSTLNSVYNDRLVSHIGVVSGSSECSRYGEFSFSYFTFVAQSSTKFEQHKNNKLLTSVEYANLHVTIDGHISAHLFVSFILSLSLRSFTIIHGCPPKNAL